MASIGHERTQETLLDDEDSVPVLKNFFSPQEQRQLIEQDRVAWRNVTSILFSIVATGLMLGIIGLTAILLH